MHLANFVFRCFPFFNTPSIIRVWWPFVRDDIVLFHVVLELSALHPAAEASPPNSLTARRAKEVMAECLRLLKDRLEDPFLRASDQTIAAVANLLAIEHSRGNVKAVKSHFSGLRLMLQLRDGLDSVKASNSIVADIVHWTAMAVADDPMQLPFEFERSDDPAPWLRVVSDPMRYDFSQLGLGEAFETTMANVDAISQRFSVVANNPSSEESVAVVDALALIIQRLLRLQFPVDRDFVIIALGDSCRYVGALHIFSPLGGYYPDSTLMSNALMHRLKSSLSIVLDSEYESDYLLLWLLQVGGISAVTLPERRWFVGHLASVAQDLGIETWVQAERALTYVIWHAVFCGVVFQQLWSEVEIHRQRMSGGGVDG
ncbi:MAG: hypothetical protein M1828_007099 [Chrysothrix sp. TS-e1954]|nr:MAG: hypothetical protein M1828_007099 [Chrysothrix sp. TS-e1954]